MSHQVCKVPKEGHFCAEVRALLCPQETQRCANKTLPVNPKHRFLSFGDTSRKQVFSTYRISNFRRFSSKIPLNPTGCK